MWYCKGLRMNHCLNIMGTGVSGSYFYFVKIKNGIGSNDLKIAFEEDSISSFGLVTDTKIPETITSLTGLLKTETADEKVSASNESQINNKPEPLGILNKYYGS